ncbi:MAG: methylmalonyl Co-A mutase-associated GTPase MeaB [Acidobacteriota bacterium]
MKKNISLDLLLKGDRRSIARAITLVENDDELAPEILSTIYKHTGSAYRIGITGPPGAGKSTLTNKLAAHFRTQNLRVGIIAIDPTSPFTGGALLGDRVRMTDVEMDDGVFIRSMASRGSLGGLSKKTRECADILDASGTDIILYETVGVGQSELDIAAAADTTVVVLVPESGDGIQAMKAGLMEIADFFVLNKADRPGANQAVITIKMTLGMRPHDETSWLPDILQAVASEGQGIAEIAAMIAKHREHMERHGTFAERRRLKMKTRVEEIVRNQLHVNFWNPERTSMLDSELAPVMALEQTPYELADMLLKHFTS